MKTTWIVRDLVRGLMALALFGTGFLGWSSIPTAPSLSGQVADPEPLLLTYVANMGVLVGSGNTKVLIDALFDKPNPEYRAPAPEALDKIMKDAAPFDGIDLVLVTHNHPDHFDADLAVRFMEARPEPLLLAPSDAVEAMRQVAADWPKIEPRVVSLDFEVGERAEKNLRGIPVAASRTLHSGNREAPMNLMYLFEIEGWRVWHEGDTNGKPDVFRGFGLDSVPLDLAIVHYWFPLEPDCSRFLQEGLRVDHIALAHLPIRLEGDAPGRIDVVRRYYQDISLLLPGMPAMTFKESRE
jgi:L-ascorbate metabolism protein UlaG (beta-lactamase superfamily)